MKKVFFIGKMKQTISVKNEESILHRLNEADFLKEK